MESLRRFHAAPAGSGGVALVARHGLLKDGRIRIEGVRTRVERDRGGWYVVRDLPPLGDARVLFRDIQDLAVIQWPGTILRVPFHSGEAEFVWEERRYVIGTMIEGEIRIRQDDRVVVRGHATVSGLRLDEVASELLPIIRPLAWALVLRSEFLARNDRFDAAPSMY